MHLLERVRVVCCRIRNPVNLGAAARALRSAGVSRLLLVDPHAIDLEAARPVAVHSEDLLGAARLLPTLDDALEGCALSIATTARQRFERPPLRPAEAVERLAASSGQVALVFGDERSGLLNEEVERCDLVSAIPSDPGQPSWNLAQTIAVYAYEVRMAALAEQQPQPRPAARAADPGRLAHLDRSLEATLSSMGWSRVRRRLARTLLRAGLSEREAQLWTALFLELKKRV